MQAYIKYTVVAIGLLLFPITIHKADEHADGACVINHGYTICGEPRKEAVLEADSNAVQVEQDEQNGLGKSAEACGKQDNPMLSDTQTMKIPVTVNMRDSTVRNSQKNEAVSDEFTTVLQDFGAFIALALVWVRQY